METFPFRLFSKYDNTCNNAETRQQESNRPSYSTGALDSSVNRIAKSIANTVIRSSENTSGRKQHTQVPMAEMKLPHIPQEAILFGAVILSKVLLFWAYKKAQDNGLEILDL